MEAISNLAHLQLDRWKKNGNKENSSSGSNNINESPFHIYPLVYLFVACTKYSERTLFNVYSVYTCVYFVDLFVLAKQTQTYILHFHVEKKSGKQTTTKI